MNEEINKRYTELAHALQSGVAMMMNINPKDTEPKHLRTGVNMALVDSASLATLLISKGIITEEEYGDALIAGLEREVESYETMISAALGGKKVKLR